MQAAVQRWPAGFSARIDLEANPLIKDLFFASS